MDDLEHIKICSRNTNPRASDLLMASVSSLIPIVNIPRKIFQLGSNDKTSNRDSLINSITDRNPEWNYQHHTLDEVRETIKLYFPDMLSVYDSYNNEMQKINIGAYIYLYIYGGVYIAPNYKCTKSLDELFYTDAEVYLTASPTYQMGYTNAFMASKPRSQFWLDVIDEAKKFHYSKPFWVIGEHLNITMSTGSGLLNNATKTTRIPYMVLPVSLIAVNNICSVGRVESESNYLQAIGTCQYEGWDAKVLNYCWCNRNWLPYVFLSILALIFVVFLYKLFTPKNIRQSPNPILIQEQRQPNFNQMNIPNNRHPMADWNPNMDMNFFNANWNNRVYPNW